MRAYLEGPVIFPVLGLNMNQTCPWEAGSMWSFQAPQHYCLGNNILFSNIQWPNWLCYTSALLNNTDVTSCCGKIKVAMHHGVILVLYFVYVVWCLLNRCGPLEGYLTLHRALRFLMFRLAPAFSCQNFTSPDQIPQCSDTTSTCSPRKLMKAGVRLDQKLLQSRRELIHSKYIGSYCFVFWLKYKQHQILKYIKTQFVRYIQTVFKIHQYLRYISS